MRLTCPACRTVVSASVPLASGPMVCPICGMLVPVTPPLDPAVVAQAFRQESSATVLSDSTVYRTVASAAGGLDGAVAHNSRGVALSNAGSFECAIAEFDRAI
jgi:hypothetical protein